MRHMRCGDSEATEVVHMQVPYIECRLCIVLFGLKVVVIFVFVVCIRIRIRIRLVILFLLVLFVLRVVAVFIGVRRAMRWLRFECALTHGRVPTQAISASPQRVLVDRARSGTEE